LQNILRHYKLCETLIFILLYKTSSIPEKAAVIFYNLISSVAIVCVSVGRHKRSGLSKYIQERTRERHDDISTFNGSHKQEQAVTMVIYWMKVL